LLHGQTDTANSTETYELCLANSGSPTNLPPVAAIVADPNSGPVGTVFLLSGAASSDVDGTIVSYAWTFGDGANATGQTVTKTFANPGTYSVTLTVTDNLGATGSAATIITVTAPVSSATNVALASNGGTASASSSYSSGFSPATTINGDRKGFNLGSTGGWHDATPSAFPDWLQVTFNAAYSIAEIDVFTVQDSYTSPADPTPGMTFSKYGITAFQVQYWNGSAWTDVPGGNVTGNNLVWRKFTFTPITTNSIRVLANAASDPYSRITEIEAWAP
jgi:PKD repeat protein